MPIIPQILRRPVRRGRAVAFVALVALAVSACSDPFKVTAQYANTSFAFSLFALSGSGPANAPAAIDFGSLGAVRVDGSFNFDVAFDFDGTGKIRILPQKLVGASVGGARSVGLQRVTGVYETVLLAPAKGWVLDSAVTVLPGEVVVVRLTSSGCVYQLSSELYAKFVIDSVKAGGLMFGRGMTNPNCGFKSFETGIPTK